MRINQFQLEESVNHFQQRKIKDFSKQAITSQSHY